MANELPQPSPLSAADVTRGTVRRSVGRSNHQPATSGLEAVDQVTQILSPVSVNPSPARTSFCLRRCRSRGPCRDVPSLGMLWLCPSGSLGEGAKIEIDSSPRKLGVEQQVERGSRRTCIDSACPTPVSFRPWIHASFGYDRRQQVQKKADSSLAINTSSLTSVHTAHKVGDGRRRGGGGFDDFLLHNTTHTTPSGSWQPQRRRRRQRQRQQVASI